MAIIEVDIKTYFQDKQRLKELNDLTRLHFIESEPDLSNDIYLDLDSYARLQEAGMLIAMVALDGEMIVGYVCVLIAKSLHYGYLTALNDSIFVHQDYRKKGHGIRLMKAAEKLAKERGAKFMTWSAKEKTSLNKILPRLGYKAEEINYIKEL